MNICSDVGNNRPETGVIGNYSQRYQTALSVLTGVLPHG